MPDMGAYWKAILAFVAAGLASLVAGTADGLLSWPDIFTALGAAIVTGGAVARVPNAGTIRVDKLPPVAELAREAYEAYAQAVGGRSVAGDPLPQWAQMADTVKDAWTRAQSAVLSVLRR